MTKKKIECVFCESEVADFIWLDGSGGKWRVCDQCIKDGECNA